MKRAILAALPIVFLVTTGAVTMCSNPEIEAAAQTKAAVIVPSPEIPQTIVICTETAPEKYPVKMAAPLPQETEPAEHEYTAVFDTASEEDKANTIKVAYLEAAFEGLAGQQAVIEVIANRAICTEFPDELTAILSAKGQFSTWRASKTLQEGKPYKPYGDPCVSFDTEREAYRTVSESGCTVIADALKEAQDAGTVKSSIVPTDYVYFCTVHAYRSIGKKYMHNIIQIGGHVFGTLKK